MTLKQFIESILPGAMETFERWGILPSVTIAQGILESSDKYGVPGASSLAAEYNNIFGIKGTGSAGSVTLPTKEFIGGKWKTIDAEFKVYNDPNESILDHGKLLGEADIYSGVREANDYKSATFRLQQAGYATDPLYAGKLNNIITKNKLYEYDKGLGAWGSGSGNSYTPGKDPAANPMPKIKLIDLSLDDILPTLAKSGIIIVAVVVGVMGLYLLVTE